MYHKLYTYQDEIHLVYDDDMVTCIKTDNRSMSSDIIKVHKGVDNNLRFRVYNRDRKPQAIDHKTIRTRIINDRTKEVVLERYASKLSDKGALELKILEADLVNIPKGFYKLIITAGEELVHGSTGQVIQTPFFTDTSNNAVINIEITGQTEAEPRPTYTITDEWTPWYDQGSPEKYYSSAIPAGRIHNYTESTHTMVVHASNFTGTLEIYGSLEDIPSNNLEGFFPVTITSTMTKLEFENHTGLVPLVFRANYMWLKLIKTIDSENEGSITKIEIRN